MANARRRAKLNWSRVPPLKIMKRGEDVEEVWKLLLANVRTPRYNYGDLRAMISATATVEEITGR